MATTINLHRPDVANSGCTASLSARAFINIAPSVLRPWQVETLHKVMSSAPLVTEGGPAPALQSAPTSTFMSLRKTSCLTVTPASRKMRPVMRSVGVAFFTLPLLTQDALRLSTLRHLQWLTKHLHDQCSEMWSHGELEACGTARQSCSRIPPRVGKMSHSSSCAAEQHGHLPDVRVSTEADQYCQPCCQSPG